MGLFGNLFKSSPKPTYETSVGTFTRVYSKRGKHLWSNSGSEVILSAKGTEERPYEEHLLALSNFTQMVQELDSQITKKFRREFREAGFNVNFSEWQDKFRLNTVEIMEVFESENYFSLTFEDTDEPYAHYTIFVEGNKINPDFSIDT